MRNFGLLTLLVLSTLDVGVAAEFDTKVPVHENGSVTYYVPANVQGFGETEFMVDTGAGYVTINEMIFRKIDQQGLANAVKRISVILANESKINLWVYRIASLDIGGKCFIRDVEVIVMPGKTRNILGLNALKRQAPFGLSVNPPELIMSNCEISAT